MILSTKLPQNKNYFSVECDGISMLPVIKSRDSIYLKSYIFNDLKVNDIILIKKNDKFFTHRIIYRDQKYLITKGDNNQVNDGKVFPKQLLGKVYKIKRGGQIFKVEDISLVQSVQYLQEIIKIKLDFDKAGIDYVFLKGLPLHLYFEKSHPRKIYADCDVLINNADWDKAQKILEKFGYRKVETSYSIVHKLLKDKPTEFLYVKKINDFPVLYDIHFEAGFLMNQLGELDALYPQSLINDMTDQFLKEKRSVKIQNQYFPILSPANLIIYLSLHFFHHNYRGWHMIDFLSRIVKRYQEDEEVLNEIKDKIIVYHLQIFVYPVFLFLQKYYNYHFSKRFLNFIKPDKNRMDYIQKNILTINIFDGEPRIKAGINRFRNLFFLSPNPLWKRLLIVFNLQVIYSAFWVITFLFKRSIIRVFKSS